MIPAPPSGTKAGPSALLLWAFCDSNFCHSTGRVPHPTTSHSRAPGRLLRASSPRCSLRPNGLRSIALCLPPCSRRRCLTDSRLQRRTPAARPNRQASAQSLRSSSGGWGLLTASVCGSLLGAARRLLPPFGQGAGRPTPLSTRSLRCAALQ